MMEKKTDNVRVVEQERRQPAVPPIASGVADEKTEMVQKADNEDKKEEQAVQNTDLTETDRYLNTGAHIGTKFKNGDMKKYIYKMRKDGLFVLDVETVDKRLKAAATLLSSVPAERIAVVARRAYGQTPANMFAQAIGAHSFTGRFIPGTFTNSQNHRFFEPKLVIVTDPETDSQAIEEATRVRSPVIGLVSTNNSLKNIDLAVPINNKGKKSLALAFWILSKEMLKTRGELKSDADFSKKVEDFEYKMKEGEEEEKRAEKTRFGQRRFGDNRGSRRFGGERRR